MFIILLHSTQLNGSSFLHHLELLKPLKEIRQRENDNKNTHTQPHIKVEEKKRERASAAILESDG